MVAWARVLGGEGSPPRTYGMTLSSLLNYLSMAPVHSRNWGKGMLNHEAYPTPNIPGPSPLSVEESLYYLGSHVTTSEMADVFSNMSQLVNTCVRQKSDLWNGLSPPSGLGKIPHTKKLMAHQRIPQSHLAAKHTPRAISAKSSLQLLIQQGRPPTS